MTEKIEWSSIAPGVMLYPGGYVTHNGQLWVCIARHEKGGDEPGKSDLWGRGYEKVGEHNG